MKNLKNIIKKVLLISIIYIVLYLTYFIDNVNIHNITYTILWLWVIILFIGSFSIRGLNVRRDNDIIKNRMVLFLRILLFGQPFVMIYFGDILLGVLYLVLLTIIYGAKANNETINQI